MANGPLPLVLAALIVLPLSGCEWFTDFKRTPMVTTWESDSILGIRGAPEGSVPTTGTAVAGFQVSYLAFPMSVDSVAALATNPTTPDSASLANGHMYFEINCAVCHGSAGRGDGAAVRFGMVPMPLVTDATKARSDGYLFAIMRNGRGAMPGYNRIEERDRWDVVNHIRALQGMLPGVTPATGPLGMPGVTGDALPGATSLGPNRGVPHRTLDRVGARGDSAAAPPGGTR